MAYFWPGLPQLWVGGSWVGLLVAVGFTALLNVLLLATLVFSEWLTRETRLIGFGALTIAWLLARWHSRDERRALRRNDEEDAEQQGLTEQHPGRLAVERDQCFREVQGDYLRNDWVAAEQSLLKLLKQDARDVESRLMLATLWWHQGRSAEALRQLDRLERLEASTKWQHEVAALRAAINQAKDIAADDIEAGSSAEKDRSDAPPERTEVEPFENNDHRDDDQQWNQRQAA